MVALATTVPVGEFNVETTGCVRPAGHTRVAYNPKGGGAGDAIAVILPMTNNELAVQIGTVRELVSRNMIRLQSEGLIVVDNRRVEMLSLKGLEAELEASGG